MPTHVRGSFEDKIERIRSVCSSLIGNKLDAYSTADLWVDSERAWEPWPDLPIRLEYGSGRVVAVAWSRFDDLWIVDDLSLPFDILGSKVRWVRNSVSQLNQAIGATITGLFLGRGEMTFDGRDVEIWSRLLVQLDRGWLEIYNALDENGYDFHVEQPIGELIACI